MQYSDLGKYIKYRRENLKISLNKFAQEADIDPAIICRTENLKQGIKISVLEKIADFYKQTPAEFLSDFEQYCRHGQ